MFSPNELDILAKVYTRILAWSEPNAGFSISDNETGGDENSTGSVKDEKENHSTTEKV